MFVTTGIHAEMLKLVIFDCDGVLFDSREANRAYYNHLLSRFGCPPMDEEELEYVHTHNVTASVAHIFRRHHQVDRAVVDRFRTELDYSPFLNSMIMAPDLLEFLRLIKPRYHTAISTNRTTTMPMILDIFKLRPWFEQVVTALDTPRPKPAPDGLHMILNHFGVTVGEAIYIGDSEVDREHTAGLGMELIAFRNPGLAAEYHVDRFMAIPGLQPFRQPGKTE
ncbi:fructose-1-P/6-phosphogluconate phosphatase [bacterium BMS3Bbin14]|nr:fructose-1-P/6-phosphogluconate phosphatase [bacterium BMS3Abin13]GBE52734.1 fructose-1-P/6-phosphogluconate phosphatase [bacterium BMS3Bbin14]